MRFLFGPYFKAILTISLFTFFCLFFASRTIYAQGGNGEVQEITGSYDSGVAGVTYLLPDLQEGQVLSIYAENSAGNFDPFIGLLDDQVDVGAISEDFQNQVKQAVAQNQDPYLVIPRVADEAFLAWSDDTGSSFDASFTIIIPKDGDYQLIITSTPLTETFGAYRMLVGLDAPEVTSGTTPTTDDEIATFLGVGVSAEVAVQIIEGELTTQNPDISYHLDDFFPGDTLYVYVEAISGDLLPRISLLAQGTKPVRSGNYDDNTTAGSLELSLPDGGSGYSLEIDADTIDGKPTTGKYRLVVGRNVPEVLTGIVAERGQSLLRLAIPVDVGAKLQQIAGVNQTSENYDAVYSIRLVWNDPELAFSSEDCQCEFQVYRDNGFSEFASEEEIDWPIFTIVNQQGNRWSQNKLVVVLPDGTATYLERFSTTLQAPDFNFRKFPFDTQEFFMAIDSLYPTEFFTYEPSTEYYEIGAQLGEEEWYIVDAQATVTETQTTTQSLTPRYDFRFTAQRHLIFYVFRIFVPLLLIILVAWITFFMVDFGKRVDATSANLLLFIAFNFTISNELPRLGYLTYLDTLMACTFIVSVLVVGYNVALKRLEILGRRERADKIDRYMIWLYPLIYAIAFGLVTLSFFGTLLPEASL